MSGAEALTQDDAPAAIGRAVVDGRLHSLREIGLQLFAPYLMNRVIGRYNATIRDELRSRNLTTPQMRALAVLAVGDGLTINDLAVYTVTEQSTMSRTLDAMEAQGLVRREAHHTDNRVRQIYLTEAGRTLFDEMWPTMWNAFSAMFAGVSDSEYETFLSVLHKMLRNVRHHDL